MFHRGVARTGSRGWGWVPNLANVSVVGRVSVKFPCYIIMLLAGPGGGGPGSPPKNLNTPLFHENEKKPRTLPSSNGRILTYIERVFHVA